MRQLSFLHLSIRLLALLLIVLATPRARAEAPVGAVGLVVFGEDLPRDDLRTALEHELGRTVTLLAGPPTNAPFVTVTWRRERSELAVTYDEPGRGTLARVVRARPTASQTIEDAVVLATSLVRNEADELLGKPAAAPTAPPAAEQVPPATGTSPTTLGRDYVPACASLFFPAATNWDHPHATTRFGFDLLYGRIGELEDGVQLGTVNLILGKPGVASGNMSGVEIATAVNYVGGHASGLQLALAANAAGEGAEGGQLALGANVAGSRMDGFQIAAFNWAGDLRGTQIGGINVAKKLTGFSLGIVNVADEVDGLPVGIVSVSRTGGIHPIAWAGSSASVNAGVKFATAYTYTIIAGQYSVAGAADYAATGDRPAIHLERRQFAGGSFFIGGHVPLNRTFFDFDLGFSALSATETSLKGAAVGAQTPYHEVLLEPRIRGMIAFSFAQHLSLFAGGALAVRARVVNEGSDKLVSAVPELLGGAQF